jgi:hypothetical protein
MRTPCEGKTDYVPGRIQELRRRLATETMPYGLPRCVVRGLLRRRANLPLGVPCPQSGSSQSEEPLKNLRRST